MEEKEEEDLEINNIDVAVTYKLGKRKIKKAPIIDFLPTDEATILVNISVDEFGNVIEAKWDVEETTGYFWGIIDKLLDTVRETEFNSIPYNTDYDAYYYTSEDYLYNPEPEYEKGQVCFVFFIDN